MEQWQKSYLTSKLYKLVDTTICSNQLLTLLESSNTLGKTESDKLKNTVDRFDKVKLLYEIIETRTDGYVAVTKALAICKQTGPYNILMEGLARNAIPDLKINFLDKTHSLTEIFDSEELGHMVQKLKPFLTVEQYLNLYDPSKEASEALKLVNDTIPEKFAFYVPRLLIKRVNVNPQLFHVDCSDVFVFKNADSVKLAKLVAPNPLASSTSQLETLSSRYITIDCDEDWQEICKIANHISVHLIRYEEHRQEYILDATTGGSQTIFQYLDRQQQQNDGNDESVGIPEEDFMENEIQEDTPGICICDLPGMGKSILLANLARKSKEQYLDRITAFISLSPLMEHLRGRRKQSILLPSNATFGRKAVLEYLTPSPLAFSILNELIDMLGVRFQLFLDGFDEVPVEHVDFAKQLLLAISKDLPTARIFVTSRPHMRHELEAALKVISYDILPFNETNQINFLVNFWKQENGQSDTNKLTEFACCCLEKIKESMNEQEGEITGIPLQCRLIAEVFARNARIYSQPNRRASIAELCKFEKSLYHMYQKFVTLRFDSILRVSLNPSRFSNDDFFVVLNHVNSIMELVAGEEACHSKIQEMKNIHFSYALKTLFPKSIEMLTAAETDELELKENSSSVLSVGMLERRWTGSSERVEFVHRTFAEYLAAELFAGVLVGDNDNNTFCGGQQSQLLTKQVVQFLFEKALKTQKVGGGGVSTSADKFDFIYPVIVYFLNCVLEEKLANFSVSQPIVDAFVSAVSKRELVGLLSAIVQNNYGNILTFVHHVLSSPRVGKFQLWKYKAKLVPWGNKTSVVTSLLNLAAAYSSTFLVTQLFQIFRACFDVDVDVVCKEMPLNVNTTPLNIACKRANFEMVLYFADKISLAGRGLLKDCVSWSYNDSPLIVQKKIEICKFLVGKNKSPEAIFPCLQKVHLDLIKYLVKEGGANAFATFDNETVLHSAIRYMSSDYFHELCRFLIEDCQAEALFNTNKEKWTDPLPLLISTSQSVADKTIEMILKISGMDVGERVKDANGHPLLLCAVKGARSVSIVKTLVQLGSKIDGEKGCMFGHQLSKVYSAEEFHEIVKLISKEQMGECFGLANKFGETPLHSAIRSLELLPETFDVLVGVNSIDLNAVDEYGKSLLHCAVEGHRSLELVKHLVKLGADWSVRSKTKTNLAHQSASLSLIDHLKYFVELGCDINEVDEEGDNALQCAVYCAWKLDPKKVLACVEFLVANGVNKKNVNEAGQTPYQMAVEKGVEDQMILAALK